MIHSSHGNLASKASVLGGFPASSMKKLRSETRRNRKRQTAKHRRTSERLALVRSINAALEPVSIDE